MTKEIAPANTNASLAWTTAVGKAAKAALLAETGSTKLTWKFTEVNADGEAVVGKPTMTSELDVRKVADAVLGYAIVHGFIQRIGDAAALGAKFHKKLQRIPTLADKKAAMDALIAHYESGDDSWDRERAGFGPRVDETLEVIVAALFKAKAGSKTEEECRAYATSKGKDWRAAVYADPNGDLFPFIKAVLAEKTKGVNVGKVLEDF